MSDDNTLGSDEYKILEHDEEDGHVDVRFFEPSLEEVSLACRHVIWVLDGDHENGQQPGGFTTALIELMCHADRLNRQKFAFTHGALMTAVDIYKTIPGGADLLRTLGTKAPEAQPGIGFSPKGN